MLRLNKLVIQQGEFNLAADWSVEKGQKLALIGPSGSGKTTLLSAIAGFTPLSSGTILIGDKDISRATPGARPVAMLFQEHNLFAHLTAGQNVGLGLRPDLKLNSTQWETVSSALARVGLVGLCERLPADLSGGQRQRVALARALLRNKPLLLLDEPFAALGPALKTEMLDLVDQIVRETKATLLMVTHAPQDAKRIADVTSFVSDGTAHAPVATEALFAKPPKALASYLGSEIPG